MALARRRPLSTRPGSAAHHRRGSRQARLRSGVSAERSGRLPGGVGGAWQESQARGGHDLDRRALDKLPKQPDDLRIEYTLIPGRPLTPSFAKEKTQYLLKGFYRGRRFSLETAVTLHHLPELVSYEPETPQTAAHLGAGQQGRLRSVCGGQQRSGHRGRLLRKHGFARERNGENPQTDGTERAENVPQENPQWRSRELTDLRRRPP